MFAHLQKTMKLILPHSRKRWCCILGYFFISIEKDTFHLFEFQRLPSMATKHIVKRLLVTKYRYYVKKISNGTPMIHSYITTTLGWSLKSHL